MADYYTPQQRAAMDAVLAGTFDKLDTSPRVQPGYTLDQIYGGILPAAAPTAVANNAPYKSPYPSPAQLAAMDAVPASSYRTPKAQPLDIQNQPYGYSYPDTGDKGRASGGMLNQLAPGLPTSAPLPPAGTPWNSLTSIDQAAIQKYAQTKPTGPITPSWTTIGPLLAQAAFKQNAFQKTNPLAGIPAAPPAAAPTVSTPWGQLSQQLFQQLVNSQQPATPGKKPVEITVTGGKSTPSQNYSLANALGAVTKQGATGTGTNGYNYVNGQNVGQSAQYAGMSPSQMYDAINAKAGNPTSSGNSGSLNSMGSSKPNGAPPEWVNRIKGVVYDSKGNISSYTF